MQTIFLGHLAKMLLIRYKNILRIIDFAFLGAKYVYILINSSY
jgi:hypothetical protein